MNRRALLAIAFAGSMLNSQLPALSENKIPSTDSVIQGIENNTRITPELRAFYLLALAGTYLDGDNRTVVEKLFRDYASERGSMQLTEKMIVSWTDRVSLRDWNQGTNAKKNATEFLYPIADENSVLAELAIQKALIQVDKIPDRYVKLNLHYIASRLFQKLGVINQAQKYNNILEDSFKSCEGGSPVNEEEIRTASSILNSMANGLLPFPIPDQMPMPIDNPWLRQKIGSSFTETDFKESEKLRLRAVKMADRLPTTNHVRRKAHRDLAVWYMQLGKVAMGEKEKQILFELVGCNDDSILYPQSVGCGTLVWWKVEKQTGSELCGMG